MELIEQRRRMIKVNSKICRELESLFNENQLDEESIDKQIKSYLTSYALFPSKYFEKVLVTESELDEMNGLLEDIIFNYITLDGLKFQHYESRSIRMMVYSKFTRLAPKVIELVIPIFRKEFLNDKA